MTPSGSVSLAGAARDAGDLRRRLTGRPPTISEDEAGGSRSPSWKARRSSSFMTDSSIDRVSSIRDDLLGRAPIENEELHEDPGLWHSLPLLFAVVPAIGGVLFKKGSVLLTDVTLLCLAAIYLNWCLVTPWVWYHNAQTINLYKPPLESPLEADDTAEEEDEQNGEPVAHDGDGKQTTDTDAQKASSDEHKDTNTAFQELRMHELAALAMCFLGPLLGAYILHILRSQMSALGDELVSNIHLTLFVLGAELRPARYAVKMVHARTLFLQRLVREDPHALPKVEDHSVMDLQAKVDALQHAIDESTKKPAAAPTNSFSGQDETFKKQQSALQSQIDALNRAVRRYEKRATAQAIQTEARLQDLEFRIKDSLTLAAAAASNSQKPGLVLTMVEKLSKMIAIPFKAAWAIIIYPFQIAVKTLKRALFRLGLLRPIRRDKMARQTQKGRSWQERERISKHF